jgi:serine/threonine protein phosphatase PrpC
MMRGIGHVCRRGKKPDSPCQDDFFVVADPGWVFAGCFDGHGPVGHLLANTAQHTVLESALLDEDALLGKTPSVLTESFEKAHAACEKMAGSHTAGTTATAVLITPETATAAWCGDSRAILAKKLDEDGKKWEIKALTFEHRPSDKKERKRIEEAGGKVEVYEGGEGAESRLFDAAMEGPGLAMSRAIGDLWGHECGMIHVPDVQTERTEGYDFFCCGSDGVWDFVSNEEVAAIVNEHGRIGATIACDKIMKLAWSRWEEEGDVVDDISFVIVWLPLQEAFQAPSI